MAMRDPDGDQGEYDRKIGELVERWKYHDSTFSDKELVSQVSVCNHRLSDAIDLLMLRYGRGDSVATIAAELALSLPAWTASFAFADLHGPQADEDYTGSWRLDGKWRDNVSFAALGLLTLETPRQLAEWCGLVDTEPGRRGYLFDLLVKSFVPDYRMARRYKSDRHQAPWTDPVLRALALPPEDRAEALAIHMKKWCRILKPWGWKPQRDHGWGKDGLFDHFAYEVALAVCAYDIDDSGFSDHPYYPRELVDWYRAHLRGTRDAWRATGAGPGVEVVAPPPPAKADLAKSKRKAIARWLELAADGNADAVESVIEAVGRPRRVEDSDALTMALYENGEAIHADIKDDETVALTAAQLAEARGLGEFEGPPGPPFGPARCEALLAAFGEWVAPRGYRLIQIESDGDAWSAVLVRAAFEDEFRALSDGLRVRLSGSAITA